MHSAPSVSYPVGRSRLEGWLIAVGVLTGVAVVLTWVVASPQPGWRHGLAATLAAISAAVALVHWRRAPQGQLRWDGGQWYWLAQSAHGVSAAPLLEDAQAVSGVAVHLDAQRTLLVRARLAAGGARWFWLQAAEQPALWPGLRRAVYSRGTAPPPTDVAPLPLPGGAGATPP